MEIVLIIISYSFLVGVFNLLFPQVFKYKKISKPLPTLSIIVPVRNEIRILTESARSLLALNYTSLEIIYYDDCSQDGSSELLDTIQSQNRNLIRLIKGGEPETGWLGKNYACYTAASKAKGEYLLFMDADVIINNRDLVAQAISYIKENLLDGLSLMPAQRSKGILSRYLVPFIMQWPIMNFMPMKLAEMINSSAIANGQFIMITKKSYQSIAGHSSVKDSLIEDIALFRKLRTYGFKIRTLFSVNDLHSYMYEDLPNTIHGFSKNIYYVFGGNIFTFIIWQILLFSNLIPFLLLPFNSNAISIVLIILLSRSLMVYRKGKGIIIELLIFPILLGILIVISWISLYSNLTKKVIWKDREVYSSSSTSIA